MTIDDLTVKDPTPAVRRAAEAAYRRRPPATGRLDFAAAREDLAAAVTVEAVLPHLPHLPASSPFVEDWPADEQEFWRDGDWADFTERQQMLDLLRRQKTALAIVTALVGAP